MRKIHKKLVAVMVGFFCLTTIGTSMASYTNKIRITNPFTTSGPSSAVMLENFSPASTFLPGETVQKQPYFKNTGEADLLLRVKITAEWKTADGIGTFTPGDPFSDDDKVIKSWTDSWNSSWIKIGDYYYYKEILEKSGSRNDKTPIILEKLQLSPTVSNDMHDTDYSDRVYELSFDAEAILANQVSAAQWKNDIGTDKGADELSWKNFLK